MSRGGIVPPTNTAISSPQPAALSPAITFAVNGRCAPGQDTQPDRVDILVDRGVDDLLGAAAKPGVDHFHPGVAQRVDDNLGAAVVTVEARLGDHHANRIASISFALRGRRFLEGAELLAQHAADFADTGVRLDRLDDRRHQVVVAARRFAQRRQRIATALVIARGLDLRQVFALAGARDGSALISSSWRRSGSSRANLLTPTTIWLAALDSLSDGGRPRPRSLSESGRSGCTAPCRPSFRSGQ